jgi:hypothetical protein
MPIVNVVDKKQYDFGVFTDDGDKFRVATEDDAPENIITFHLCKMLYEERTKIDDDLMFSKGNKTSYRLGTQQRKTLLACVRGWDGIQGEDGQPIAFAQKEIDKFPGTLIKVLDDHIVDVNGLRGDQEKN